MIKTVNNRMWRYRYANRPVARGTSPAQAMTEKLARKRERAAVKQVLNTAIDQWHYTRLEQLVTRQVSQLSDPVVDRVVALISE